MISIAKMRELIPDNKKLTDEELTEVRRDLYGFADLAFDVWLARKRMSKKPKMNS